METVISDRAYLVYKHSIGCLSYRRLTGLKKLQGKTQAKDSTPSVGRFCRDRAALLFKNLSGKIKADARPFCLFYDWVAAPIETLKDLIVFFFGNTDSLIGNI